jgi:hypothetical protein
MQWTPSSANGSGSTANHLHRELPKRGIDADVLSDRVDPPARDVSAGCSPSCVASGHQVLVHDVVDVPEISSEVVRTTGLQESLGWVGRPASVAVTDQSGVLREP